MDNIFQLLLLIIGPLAASIIVIATVFGSRKIYRKSPLKVFILQPNVGLANQGLFWLSTLTPILYFFAFGIISWQGYQISITSEGFKTFIAISSLPLALLTLAIPFGVVVARFHSTEQTAEQIQIAKHKNNLDAFYSHRKEFFAYFDKIGTVTFLDVLEVKYMINPRLHGLMFKGNAKDGTPELDSDLSCLLVAYLNSVRKCLNAVILDSEPAKTFDHYFKASEDAYWIARKLGIKEIVNELPKNSSTLISFDSDSEKEIGQKSLGTTTVEAIAAFRCIKSYILTIFHFSGSNDYIDMIYKSEIPHIDINGYFSTINPHRQVIEEGFAYNSEHPWETQESRLRNWISG
ncbi:hypothetical protein KIH32_10630 [Pseudomonas fluorescens]|uniref:hypothetical protein n=1 Tax=Pseudomonas fluorescens TaxID=294 RepID=UPI001BDB69CD|nr:hypothetical protein [Pseudomonas fluorescens]MBT0624362.1 hypothetical protein [Pseudomonas fluorescens]